MLTIVATVCLLYSQPHKCKEVHLSYAAEITALQACMSPMPLIEMAKYLEAHPKWYLKRYTCVSGEIGKDI